MSDVHEWLQSVTAMTSSTNPQTVASIYRDHHGWLRGWLHRHLGCSETAADLAQDTFLRLMRRAPAQAQSLREPRAYLSSMARGLLFNHWRRQALEKAYLDTLANQPEPIVASPEEQQLIIDTLARLAAVVDGLSDRDRQVFLLARLDGLKYKEIADALGISVNVVQKAMGRAMLNCYSVLYE
ncbi:MAG: sigma-70 family RNA polymerase sigma factor [Pseudomonadota bacterium]